MTKTEGVDFDSCKNDNLMINIQREPREVYNLKDANHGPIYTNGPEIDIDLPVDSYDS